MVHMHARMGQHVWILSVLITVHAPVDLRVSTTMQFDKLRCILISFLSLAGIYYFVPFSAGVRCETVVTEVLEDSSLNWLIPLVIVLALLLIIIIIVIWYIWWSRRYVQFLHVQEKHVVNYVIL